MRQLLKIFRYAARDERGATALVMVLIFSALFTMLAAAVDTSRLMLARNKLQSALDAAAIAAVRDANTQNINQEVTKFFNANFPNGYMGMTPGTINVSVNGNSYTFTMTSNLPQSLFPSLGLGGSGSNTITVSATITASSGGGGPATELSLILDSSSNMNQSVSGNTTRLDILKAAVGTTSGNSLGIQSLMDRIQGRGAYVSMVNFNDGVRIDPAISNNWLQYPFSNTLSDFSNQTYNNHGRFDGCLSTKYNENNSGYPQSNSNTYLNNDDDAPTGADKLRQYIGPVDFSSYSQSQLYYNYSYDSNAKYRLVNFNTNPPTYSQPIITSQGQYTYGANYETGTNSNSSLVTPFHRGAIGVDDDVYTPYTYTTTYNYNYYINTYYNGLEYVYSYDLHEGNNPTMYLYRGETSALNVVGSAQQYNYINLRTYSYITEQVEDRRPNSTTHEVASRKNSILTRTIHFGASYVYAMKVYMGYKPVNSSAFVNWDAYNDAGVRVATGSAPVSAVSGGNQSQGTSYMAEVIFPTPFKPFAKVIITYPRFGGYTGQCAANSPHYDYCQECHKTGYNGQYQCQYCDNGSCSNYQSLANSFNNSFGGYDAFDYHYIRASIYSTALYTTCGQLVKSAFMQTDTDVIKSAANNLVATGAARVNIGLNWGWRTLSPKWRGLFNSSATTSALPSDYNTGNTKVAVLMTQGENFKNNAKTLNNSNGTYFDDNSLSTLCTNIKNKGIKLYVIGVDVNSSATQARLRNCADSNQNYFNVTSTSNGQINGLNQILGRIADNVSSSGTGTLQFGAQTP